MNPSTTGDSVVLRGVVLNQTSGSPVFYAKVRLPAARTAIYTADDGRFKFVLPRSAKAQSIRLIILKPGFWPRITQVAVPKGAGSVAIGDVPVAPLPDFMSQGIHGYLISLLGPRLLAALLGLTRLEMLLVVMTILFLLPPVALGLIARGLPVPGTELDEKIREQMLTRQWAIAVDKPVVFSKVRAFYLAHVKYRIPQGDYLVPHQVTLAPGSEVVVDPGTVFKLGANAGFLVRGVLKAEGTSDRKIMFLRTDSSARPWSNITFWEELATGSKLAYCRIEGGSGRRALGSESGSLKLIESGYPVGGGVLIHNATVVLDHVEIENCQADFGGAAYLRNSPDQVGMPGSRFKEVRILKCHAEITDLGSTRLAGGGGVWIQRTNPHFESCLFSENEVKGSFSCGGAVYLGRDAQAVFNGCDFTDNKAAYSGGAIYAREAGESTELMLSGLNVHGGTFKDNHAHGTGGAISAENTRIRLTDVSFTGNVVSTVPMAGETEAKATGGAVYLIYTGTFDKPAMTGRVASAIEGCIFTSNRAEVPDGLAPKPDNVAGGAFALMASTRLNFRFANLRFNSNSARFGREVAVAPSSYIKGWSGRWTADVDPGQALSAPEAVRVVWPVGSNLLSIDASHALPAHCYGDRPAQAIVNTVVLHYISAAMIHPENPYNLQQVLGIFTRQSAPSEPYTSAHYLIDRNGQIYALVDEAKRAWHAGLSRMASGEEDVNDFSVGIEMMMTSSDPPTNRQYATLARLVADIRRRHPAVTLNRIVGHEAIRAAWNQAHPENQAPPKPDPGPLFDWNLFKAHLQLVEPEQ